jgi:hypothetical protein
MYKSNEAPFETNRVPCFSILVKDGKHVCGGSLMSEGKGNRQPRVENAGPGPGFFLFASSKCYNNSRNRSLLRLNEQVPFGSLT